MENRFRHSPLLAACLAVLALAAIGLAYLELGRITTVTVGDTTHWHTNDDSMITLRVAENFARSGVPFFNVDEAVSANTSLFWPILVSPVFLIFDNPSAIPALIAFSLLMSVAAAYVGTSIIQPAIARFATFLALLIGPAFLRFAPSVWEHIPQMLLCTVAFVGVYRASSLPDRLVIPTWTLFVLAVAFLVRADTAPTIAVFVLVWFVLDERYKKGRTYLILALLLAAPAMYLAGMNYFYGDIVPNTAHLKVLDARTSAILGFNYITSPLRSGPVPMMLIALVLLRNLSPSGWLIVYGAIAHLVYVVSVGGDYFTTGRFFLHYLPITSALLVVGLLSRFPSLADSRLAQAAPLLLALVVTGVTASNERLRAISRFGAEPLHIQQIRAVRHVAERIDPSEGSIGLHFLGIGYHVPEFHVVDFLGKADPVISRTEPRNAIIGHNKWDYDYSLDEYDVAAVPIPVVYRDITDATDLPAFWAHANAALRARGYVLVEAEQLGNPEGTIGVYVKPELAERFR